jgi:PTH1 family peptidyl-tRNA hydrolase
MDQMANEFNLSFTLKKHAMITEGRLKNKSFVLIKPTTFMNLSGTAVRYYMQEYKVLAENILVVTDDLALEVGILRLRGKGSHGGHNGLRNIEEVLQTQQYPRLRFGIGNQFPKHKQIDFVLGKWSTNEQILVNEKIIKASDCIKHFMLEGISQAMTHFNG